MAHCQHMTGEQLCLGGGWLITARHGTAHHAQGLTVLCIHVRVLLCGARTAVLNQGSSQPVCVVQLNIKTKTCVCDCCMPHCR